MADETKTRIMVVDDEAAVRKLVAAFLEREGFEVLQACNGKECLESLEAQPGCDLIILDWMMPKLDGMGVLEELMQQEDPPPVLMLSARTLREDVMKALEAGAKDFVLKPVHKDTLLFKIKGILKQHGDSARKRAARRKPVNLGAYTVFAIVRLDEDGVYLESTFPLAKGTTVTVESQELSLKLDLPRSQHYSVRVAGCEGKGNKYRLYGEFVGLTQVVRDNIHKVSQEGGWTR